MSTAPELPESVSSNGQELWDWAGKASEWIHRQARIGELSKQVSQFSCGDCDKWMKSRQCPRERNVNGWNKGPSMNAPICNEFVETQSDKNLRAERAEELARLRKL